MSSSYSTYSRSPSPAKPAGQASRPVTARANNRADSDSYSYSSSSPEPERGRGPARQTAVLRVRNLTRNVGVEHLREIFGLYGKIMSVELAIDQAVGLSKGYAFVEFATARLAEDAIHHMDGGEIDSQRVSVSFVGTAREGVRRSPDRARSPGRGRPPPRGRSPEARRSPFRRRPNDRSPRGGYGRPLPPRRFSPPPRRGRPLSPRFRRDRSYSPPPRRYRSPPRNSGRLSPPRRSVSPPYRRSRSRSPGMRRSPLRTRRSPPRRSPPPRSLPRRSPPPRSPPRRSPAARSPLRRGERRDPGSRSSPSG